SQNGWEEIRTSCSTIKIVPIIPKHYTPSIPLYLYTFTPLYLYTFIPLYLYTLFPYSLFPYFLHLPTTHPPLSLPPQRGRVRLKCRRGWSCRLRRISVAFFS